MWAYISVGIFIILILSLVFTKQKTMRLTRERDQLKTALDAAESSARMDKAEFENQRKAYVAELENQKEKHKSELENKKKEWEDLIDKSCINQEAPLADTPGKPNECKDRLLWYEVILDAVPFPVSVTDMEGKWVFVNAPAEEIMGAKRADVIGRPCSNWGSTICGTKNCGIKSLESGKPSTTLTHSGKKFRIDTRYLLDGESKKIGCMELFLDKTFMYESREEDMEFLDGLSQVVQSFVQAAKDIDEDAAGLAENSTRQDSSVAALLTSISEIAAKTKANTALAGQASKLADIIRENAEKGSAKIDRLSQTVEDINAFIQSISKVFRFINDIASQTNLLALNAAVEAARAGQHGRGFAVVAEEVRSLAAKSAASAKETSELITDSLKKSQLGVQIAAETSASFMEIVSGVEKSSLITKEILVSSEDQTKAIININEEIDRVSQGSRKNSLMAKESADASAAMNSDVMRIRELVDTYSESLIDFYDHNINKG